MLLFKIAMHYTGMHIYVLLSSSFAVFNKVDVSNYDCHMSRDWI
jgi:hypothetical protein